MFEGQKAYRIPDDKREEYFAWVDKCKLKIHDDSIWNTKNDPIVIIDMSYFTFAQTIGIRLFMSRIGAKDVSEMYFETVNN